MTASGWAPQDKRMDVPPVADFEAFFRGESGRLFRALFLVTGRTGEAEEAMQDAFLKVWRRWDRIRAMDDPQGYLYRTAMNECRNQYRRRVRLSRRDFDRPAPADAFEVIDSRDLLARGLRQLAPRQRMAVVLTDLLGFDAAAVSKLMKVAPATVRSLSSQARAALREHVGDEDD